MNWKYEIVYALFPLAQWVASLRPRLGGEPPWFLCYCFVGFVSWSYWCSLHKREDVISIDIGDGWIISILLYASYGDCKNRFLCFFSYCHVRRIVKFCMYFNLYQLCGWFEISPPYVLYCSVEEMYVWRNERSMKVNHVVLLI